MFEEICEQFGVTKENLRKFFSGAGAWCLSFQATIVLTILLWAITGQVTEVGMTPLTGIEIVGYLVLWIFFTLMVRWLLFVSVPRIAEAKRIIWAKVPEQGRKKKKRENWEQMEINDDSDEKSVDEFLDSSRRYLTLD